MPLYTIKCNECNATEEVLQRSGADAPPPCSKCGSTDTERLLSRAAVCSSSASGSACPTGTCPFAGG